MERTKLNASPSPRFLCLSETMTSHRQSSSSASHQHWSSTSTKILREEERYVSTCRPQIMIAHLLLYSCILYIITPPVVSFSCCVGWVVNIDLSVEDSMQSYACKGTGGKKLSIPLLLYVSCTCGYNLTNNLVSVRLGLAAPTICRPLDGYR